MNLGKTKMLLKRGMRSIIFLLLLTSSLNAEWIDGNEVYKVEKKGWSVGFNAGALGYTYLRDSDLRDSDMYFEFINFLFTFGGDPGFGFGISLVEIVGNPFSVVDPSAFGEPSASVVPLFSPRFYFTNHTGFSTLYSFFEMGRANLYSGPRNASGVGYRLGVGLQFSPFGLETGIGGGIGGPEGFENPFYFYVGLPIGFIEHKFREKTTISSYISLGILSVNDKNDNGFIENNEDGYIKLGLKNNAEKGADVEIMLSGDALDIIDAEPLPSVSLSSGERRDVEIKIKGKDKVVPGKYRLEVIARERRGSTARGEVMISTKQFRPPYLTQRLLYIKDEDGDGVLDAGESVSAGIEVKNRGKGSAYGVKTRLTLSLPEVSPLTVENDIGEIEPEGAKKAGFSFNIPVGAKTGDSEVFIETEDISGYKAERVSLSMKSSALPPPVFKLYTIIDDDLVGESSGNGNGRIEKGETIELRLNVKNEGKGNAMDVMVEGAFPEGIEILEPETKLGNIIPGASTEGVLLFSVRDDFPSKSLDIRFNIRERTGLFPYSISKSYPVGERGGRVEIPAQIVETGKPLPYLAVWGTSLGANVPKWVDPELISSLIIESATFTGQFNVLTKENVWSTLKDQGIQVNEEFWRRCTEAQCLVDYGRMLNANYIINSELRVFMDEFVLTLSIFDVSGSRILKKVTKNERVRDFSGLRSLVNSACEELFGGR